MIEDWVMCVLVGGFFLVVVVVVVGWRGGGVCHKKTDVF